MVWHVLPGDVKGVRLSQGVMNFWEHSGYRCPTFKLRATLHAGIIIFSVGVT